MPRFLCRKPTPLASRLAQLAFLAGSAAAIGLPVVATAAPPAKPAPTAVAATPAAPKKADPAARAAADRLEPLARAAFWQNEVQLDPTDTIAGVKLATTLRLLGRNDEAAQAAEQVLVIRPDDLDALLETGRARIAQGEAFYGIANLEHAQALAPKDWRPPSLLAVAYGEVKRDADSRAAFDRALQLSPDNPSILSNLAMSLAAKGDAPGAERLLRKAAAQPAATARERQNLALVLGYEGKLGEAEQLIRRDLPPEMADANIAYLKAAVEAR